MNVQSFARVFKKQIDTCEDVLVTKAEEYATEDRLHNFKVAAALQGTTARKALAGMMSKHTVSIYDMCQDQYSYPLDIWDEKITDHINYLILLRAIIEDESDVDIQEDTPLLDVSDLQKFSKRTQDQNSYNYPKECPE